MAGGREVYLYGSGSASVMHWERKHKNKDCPGKAVCSGQLGLAQSAKREAIIGGKGKLTCKVH